jgi:hypothetical protein
MQCSQLKISLEFSTENQFRILESHLNVAGSVGASTKLINRPTIGDRLDAWPQD